MPNFTILLAPAEGKTDGGNPFAPDMFDYRTSNTFNYFHDLNLDRRKVIDTLQATIRNSEEEALSKLFGIQGDYLDEAIKANMKIYQAPLMSALERYSPGVMYKAMDFAGLPTGAQRRLLENGLILSGMFGLLRPDDLIPNYRLKMDASLPEFGRVGKFWRERHSELLNQTLEGRVVWNLLPGAQQAAWEDARTYQMMITVRFEHVTNEGRKTISHGVKTLRGQLVNLIVRESLEDPEMLHEWTHPAGYVLDVEASSWDESRLHHDLVMVKEVA